MNGICPNAQWENFNIPGFSFFLYIHEEFHSAKKQEQGIAFYTIVKLCVRGDYILLMIQYCAKTIH